MAEVTEIQYEEKHDPEKRKRTLWTLLALSAFIDIMTSTGTLVTLGLGVVIEEAIENAISRLIARFGLKENLNWVDHAVGVIPIPGVTAITVHCARELFKMYQEETLAKQSG